MKSDIRLLSKVKMYKPLMRIREITYRYLIVLSKDTSKNRAKVVELTTLLNNLDILRDYIAKSLAYPDEVNKIVNTALAIDNYLRIQDQIKLSFEIGHITATVHNEYIEPMSDLYSQLEDYYNKHVSIYKQNNNSELDDKSSLNLT